MLCFQPWNFVLGELSKTTQEKHDILGKTQKTYEFRHGKTEHLILRCRFEIPFRCLPEVEMQQKIAFWKAERLSFSVSKDSALEDASIASYSDFESDRSAVIRLRRRASGGNLAKNTKLFEILRFLEIHQFHLNLENSLEFLQISLDCLKFFKT